MDWRMKAFNLLPEFRGVIEKQQDPIGLWFELCYSLNRIYENLPLDNDRIGRIYDYAAWCFNQPSTDDTITDPSNAAAVGFIENIPLYKSISQDLFRWMSRETFDGCEQLFRYHFSKEEFEMFSTSFYESKKTFKGTPRL